MSQARAVWKFIGSGTNRKILSWVGGGMAVIIGGLFAWYTSMQEPKVNPPHEIISVGPGGVGIKGAVTNSPVTTNVKTAK